MRPALTAVLLERQDDGAVSPGLLSAIEREAAHLTRRDGRRRLIVESSEGTPSISESAPEEGSGLIVLTEINLA